jgi:hypothetical protein
MDAVMQVEQIDGANAEIGHAGGPEGGMERSGERKVFDGRLRHVVAETEGPDSFTWQGFTPREAAIAGIATG